ncbi:hypothetical protein [Variovorax sp. PBS-H4]|uniref:hypothetical protein n=1 Tax=Variovorax sp. PBS-H4 TaxID=434008 RepID=UPI0013A5B4E7|nr:hypothetical protein [Variovorax sp. PBS-H4]
MHAADAGRACFDLVRQLRKEPSRLKVVRSPGGSYTAPHAQAFPHPAAQSAPDCDALRTFVGEQFKRWRHLVKDKNITSTD